jgi:hypothetical protein
VDLIFYNILTAVSIDFLRVNNTKKITAVGDELTLAGIASFRWFCSFDQYNLLIWMHIL